MWCFIEMHRYLTSLFLSDHRRLVVAKSNSKVGGCRTNALHVELNYGYQISSIVIGSLDTGCLSAHIPALPNMVNERVR